VKVTQPVAEYGPPSYVPPPPITEAPLRVKVVEQPPPPVKVYQQIAFQAPPPAITVQKVAVAAPPPPAVAVQAAPVLGLYAGAIGYHTHTNNHDSYLHSYGTQGFQVTSSRKFNKAILTVPQVQKQVTQVYAHPPPQVFVQKTVQPAPVYGPPPPQVFVQKTIQPAPIYGPPQTVRVVQPRPVYGPPKVVQQQIAITQPVASVQAIAPAAPLLTAPQPQQPVFAAAPAVAVTGKKQNPLTFAYSYDQGGAKVSHSYSGSGW